MRIIVMSIELDDTNYPKFVDSGTHNLTINEVKDTIHQSIDDQFEDLVEKMKQSGKEFDNGIIIMPLVKFNYKN